jgi:DNA ligase (NAD+)
VNVRAIRSVPLQLRARRWPAVARGARRVFMTRRSFPLLERTGDVSAAKNLREIRATRAAGSLRQLDPSITAARSLDLFFLRCAGDRRLEGSRRGTARCSPPCATSAAHLSGDSSRRRGRGLPRVITPRRDLRDKLPYDIDGVVYKVDRLDWQRDLGFVAARPALGHRPQVSCHEETTTVLTTCGST